jgi:hypothetical protein
MITTDPFVAAVMTVATVFPAFMWMRAERRARQAEAEVKRLTDRDEKGRFVRNEQP